MGRVGAIVAAVTAPSEALRLVEELEGALDPDSPLTPWMRTAAGKLKERIRDGVVEGGLWIGPKDEAVGLATWSLPAGAGRHAVVFLADGYRTGAALAAFVRALDRFGPLRSVDGPIPGLSDREVGAALAPLGFHPIERGDMVFPATAPVPLLPEPAEFPSRPLGLADESRLARLIERAYARTPDRWLFAQTPAEDFGDLAASELLGTGVGVWRPEASFGIEVAGALVAATLVNELDGPLLSEVMVDPAWRRRGFARRLVARSISAVRSLGLGPLRLVVRIGNDRAEPLYRSIGFVASPVRGTLWLRLPEAAPTAGEGSSD